MGRGLAMKWYIGIDGGGTKTAFVIGTENGNPVHTIMRSGCSYQSIGINAVVVLITSGIRDILLESNVQPEDCVGCCIGLPCFGENKAMDQIIVNELTEAISPIPVKIVNDGIVGWAGSLECCEGIHLVAGTGSIAIGCGADGSFARSGGWTEFFGDEGSCYWIGREGMSLFSKEADGRMPKSALYSIIRDTYDLKNDFAFIDKVINELAPYREKTAAFQRHVLDAANAGDMAAQEIYSHAAKELALIISGVKSQLSWSSETVKVSYYGGLFHAGDWILRPLTEELTALGCTVQKPMRSATDGALLLAIKEFNNKEGKMCF